MRAGRLFGLLLMAGLAALLVIAQLGLTARPATASATALASSRLEIGLDSSPDQLAWMRSSGVPWRFRYQYLSGGVNTGSSWVHWQDASAAPGQFAADYMAASGGAGYVPFFPYYVLLQSTPASGGDEASKDFGNLNNAA